MPDVVDSQPFHCSDSEAEHQQIECPIAHYTYPLPTVPTRPVPSNWPSSYAGGSGSVHRAEAGEVRPRERDLGEYRRYRPRRFGIARSELVRAHCLGSRLARPHVAFGSLPAPNPSTFTRQEKCKRKVRNLRTHQKESQHRARARATTHSLAMSGNSSSLSAYSCMPYCACQC